MHRTWTRIGWARLPWLAPAALLAVVNGAAAQDSECTSDADCGLGRACEAVGATTCQATPPCAPGEACPAPEPCVSQEFYQCVAGPCSDDADCPGGERCVSETWTECTVSANAGCAVDETGGPVDCDISPDQPTDPADCQTMTRSVCQPAWAAPCSVAADCGPGFTCEQAQTCWCTGSGPIEDPATQPSAPPVADGGGSVDGDSAGPGLPVAGSDAPPPVPTTPTPGDAQCGCDPIDEYYCALVDTPCQTDSDCATGLTCQDWAISQPPCSDGAAPPDSAPVQDAGVADASGGSTDPTDPGAQTPPPAPAAPVAPAGCAGEVTVERRCMPPGYWGGFPSQGPGAPASDSGNSAGEGADGTPVPPTPGPESPPQPSDADADDNDHSEASHHHRRRHRLFGLWCSAAAGPQAFGDAALWLGLPLLVLLRRRRVRD